MSKFQTTLPKCLFMIRDLSRRHLVGGRARIFAGFFLWCALSSCAQSTPYHTPTGLPSANPLPATEQIDLLPPTATASPPPPRPAPVTTPFTEVTLPFQPFPVTEGEYIALVNGRVIDGTGAPAWLDWTVLIQGTQMIAAGPDVVIPDGARIVDLTGQTLLPGMFDMHGHLYASDGRSMTAQFTTYPPLYLAGGVTTIFTAGDFDPEGAILLRENINDGMAIGPHILTAGPYFSGGSAPYWMLTAKTPEEMLALYDEWDDKIDGVKIYTGIREDQFAVLLEAAHADGLVVTGHLGSITAMRAIELGLDGIEHGIFSMSEFGARYCDTSELDVTAPTFNNMVDALVEHGTYLDPTIVTFQPELPDFKPLVADWEKYLDPSARMPLQEFLSSIVQHNSCLQTALEKQAQLVKAVHDRGGLIVTGTDPVLPIILPGYGLHRELQNLVAAGLSPLEAIRAATLNAAIATRLDSQKGTIAAGKIADLVVVEGNPDEDITAIGNTRLVFKDGVPYLPEALRKSVEGQIGKGN